MGKNNTELLKIAQKYLGQGGARFRKYCGLPSGAAWCNAYVTYIFAEGGDSALYCNGKKQTYCPTSMKLCVKDMAQIPMYLAMPMDVIYFDWDRNGVPNHIGFVKSKVSTETINTIEGNTSNKVMYKTRPSKYVCAIFRPHFKASYKIGLLTVDGDCGYSTIAMLQTVLGGCTVDGILGKDTVKRLQHYLAITEDGAWGTATSKALQKVIGTKVDGAFGSNSVKALQNWINKKYKPDAYKPVPTPTPTKPTAPTPKGYGGAFPDLVVHSGQKIAYTARDLAWAKGTKKATYKYPKGSARQTFKNAINKVYPKRSSWSKQCQAGASCDVGAGTIIRFSGYDTTVPRGLEEQLDHFKKSSLWTKTGQSKCSKAGDVAMQPSPSAHIWIGLGDGNLAEANHTWKYFEHITGDSRKINGKAKSGVYRACKPTPIRKGDRGTEVTRLQNFLNWYGNYALKPDGDFGAQTELAVKNFQSKNALTADGIFGTASLAKAKAVKK